MKRLVMGAACMLLFAAGIASADDLKDATDKVQPLTERLAKLSSGTVGADSKNQLALAQDTLGAVKAALSAKNGPLALQKTELADIQMTIAEAKSDELESSEQLVLRRAELKKFDAQFDQLLQTGGK
jgi:hypothetical protein